MAQIIYLILIIFINSLTSEGQDQVNPLEGELFEGDIMGITAEDVVPADYEDEGLANAVRDRNKLWTGGVIPYKIASGFSASQTATIKKAIKEYHAKTCIRFKLRTNQKYFIKITKVGEGNCGSPIGREEKPNKGQIITLTDNCANSVGLVIHELMHTVGFYHEQSRTDRNDWIEVIYSNVKPMYKDNFLSYKKDKIDDLGTEYDYGSIMHYAPTDFAIEKGKPTIRAKRPVGEKKMGQRAGFSKTDLLKINKLYKCNKKLRKL